MGPQRGGDWAPEADVLMRRLVGSQWECVLTPKRVAHVDCFKRSFRSCQEALTGRLWKAGQPWQGLQAPIHIFS